MQLGGLDNLMMEGELPNLPLHIAAAMIYSGDEKQSGAFVYEHMSQMLNEIAATRLPVLRSKLERLPLQLDKSYWVEDKSFNLASHLHRVALPQPANWMEFYRLFGQFHAEPLDQSRPLWQLTLVEGLDNLEGVSPNSFAVFVKIHHALMDGKSAMQLLRSMHSLSHDPNGPPLANSLPLLEFSGQDYRAPSGWLKYGKAWWHSIERPIDLTLTLVKLLPQLWQPKKKFGEGEDHPVPQSHFNHAVAADRVVGHVHMEMKVLKKLCKKYDCTLNDLALCTVAGAMREFLNARGELTEDSLIAAMPIDIRGRHKEGDVGNQVSLARIALHTDTDDVAARLRAITTQTSHSKKKSKKASAHALLDIVDDIHPALLFWLSQLLTHGNNLDKVPTLVNTVITNVPGIGDEAYIAGAKLVDYLGFGPLAPNMGLFHTVSSTTAQVNISFTSTADFVGSGEEYRAALESSWSQLVKLSRARK